MVRLNNRIICDSDLTFFQWLNIYELMTKKEFKDLPEYKKENYRSEYDMWRKGTSQYCK